MPWPVAGNGSQGAFGRQKQRGVDVLFLWETHLDEWLVECSITRLNMDFKEVVRSKGPHQYMQTFIEALEDCHLTDFRHVGNKFTCQRGAIRERLDPALTNDGWNSKFPNAILENL